MAKRTLYLRKPVTQCSGSDTRGLIRRVQQRQALCPSQLPRPLLWEQVSGGRAGGRADSIRRPVPARKRFSNRAPKACCKLEHVCFVHSAGLQCVGAATYFYRHKKTLPFKVAYFLSWPILGSAILYAFMPTQQQMKKVR